MHFSKYVSWGLGRLPGVALALALARLSDLTPFQGRLPSQLRSTFLCASNDRRRDHVRIRGGPDLNAFFFLAARQTPAAHQRPCDRRWNVLISCRPPCLQLPASRLDSMRNVGAAAQLIAAVVSYMSVGDNRGSSRTPRMAPCSGPTTSPGQTG